MDAITIIIIVLLVLFVILIIWIIRLEWRLKKLFRGKKAGDLEGIIHLIGDEIKNLDEARLRAEKITRQLDQRLKRSLKGAEVMRFNPFSNSGSNQSFSIALVDEEGNGLVLTSLYARDNVSVYAKPIKNYNSEYELSHEEKEVIHRVKLS